MKTLLTINALCFAAITAFVLDFVHFGWLLCVAAALILIAYATARTGERR